MLVVVGSIEIKLHFLDLRIRVKLKRVLLLKTVDVCLIFTFNERKNLYPFIGKLYQIIFVFRYSYSEWRF